MVLPRTAVRPLAAAAFLACALRACVVHRGTSVVSGWQVRVPRGFVSGGFRGAWAVSGRPRKGGTYRRYEGHNTASLYVPGGQLTTVYVRRRNTVDTCVRTKLAITSEAPLYSPLENGSSAPRSC